MRLREQPWIEDAEHPYFYAGDNGDEDEDEIEDDDEDFDEDFDEDEFDDDEAEEGDEAEA